MFHSLKVNGHEGSVRWGYLPAVSFGPWQYEGVGKVGTLIAQIVSCDEFRVSQTPLVVVVPAGRAEWRWSVRNLQINGSTLTASVERL
jgi:hypothetical protein